jgi:Ca-activated chloride channel family protein
MTLEKTLNNKLLASNLLFALFLIFIVIALIGPKWGMGYVSSEYRRGLDLVFAIDVSRSMDISDAQEMTASISVSHTRLERGLLIARDCVASVSGARYAAAIGRGRGYLAVPLTYDSEAALTFFESLDSSSMTGRSTNLEALVEAAADAFQDASPARKIIVLISDGESHSGILRNAINRCVKEGIMIYAVALGSDEGRHITIQDSPDAELEISRRDTAVMRYAAERTDGIYIDGGKDDAASALSSHLLSLSHEMEKRNSKKEPKQRRPLFIILALLSYAASKFITRQFGINKKNAALSSPFALIVLILTLFSSCTEGKLLLMEANYLNTRARYDEALTKYLEAQNHKDAAPYAEYGLGLTFYLLDEGNAALQRYADSQKMLEKSSETEHRELRYRNNYNSGIILFEEGDYEAAAEFFKEALRAAPERIDAKRNLELSLLSISMESKTENRSEAQEEQREILFEFLKQEEQKVWKSRQWEPENIYTGSDY